VVVATLLDNSVSADSVGSVDPHGVGSSVVSVGFDDPSGSDGSEASGGSKS
jgi:hypothetical protein